MLADVDEPTLPFGLQDVRGDGSTIRRTLPAPGQRPGQRLRAQARLLGVSTAGLFHLAGAGAGGHFRVATAWCSALCWLAVCKVGRAQTVPSGYFNINTLPLRTDIDAQGARAAVRATHARLTALLGHTRIPGPGATLQRGGVTGTAVQLDAQLSPSRRRNAVRPKHSRPGKACKPWSTMGAPTTR